MSACDTCAFRPGSQTHDQEPYNALRGVLCALGGRPFHCHYVNGEDRHDDQTYLVRVLWGQVDGATVHLCEGWKQAVREYKAKHLFDDPAIRQLRHTAADRALVVIDEFIDAPEDSPEKAELNRELASLVHLLAAPPEAEAA